MMQFVVVVVADVVVLFVEFVIVMDE